MESIHILANRDRLEHRLSLNWRGSGNCTRDAVHRRIRVERRDPLKHTRRIGVLRIIEPERFDPRLSHAATLLRTYTEEAGSPPTRITARRGLDTARSKRRSVVGQAATQLGRQGISIRMRADIGQVP